jgi:2-polyprenyl-3-methyl-5-hydroxy-6-metoxy-1,4-benzoquinol methylase
MMSSLKPGVGVGAGFEGLEPLRRHNFEVLLGRLEKYFPLAGAEMLEIGCSSGLFLEMAGRRKIKATGLEPDPVRAAEARAKGADVIQGFFPEALPEGEKFDIIVFNDVFEHLPEPVAALGICENRLKAGGVLVLNLPDSNGFFYRLADIMDRCGCCIFLDRLWQKDFPSPHLAYFNGENLKKLAEGHAVLECVHTSRLPSVTLSGLKGRILNGGAGGWLLYAGILMLLPLQRLLPSDILLQFYRKN